MFVIESLLFTYCSGGKPHVHIISCELITKHIDFTSNNLKKKGLGGSQTVQPIIYDKNVKIWRLSQKHIQLSVPFG